MIYDILIAGCGKTALDWGSYILSYGHRITWVSRSSERIASLEKKINRIKKRSGNLNAELLHLDNINQKSYDIIFEAIEEDVHFKKEIWKKIINFSNNNSLLITNSSSIFPDNISKGLLGCHGFYPILLTKVAEVINCESTNNSKQERLVDFLKSLEIYPIIQSNENNAFAVNRLLIPLQEEAFRRLYSGEDPSVIDNNTLEAGFPAGLLTMIDSIGINVLHNSLINYKKRFECNCESILKGTELLLKNKYLGIKNKSGIITGKLDIEFNDSSIPKPSNESFKDIWNSVCDRFISNGILSKTDLDIVRSSVFMLDQ